MSTHLSKVPTPWVFEDYFLRSEVIRETEQCHIVKIVLCIKLVEVMLILAYALSSGYTVQLFIAFQFRYVSRFLEISSKRCLQLVVFITIFLSEEI